MERKWDLATPQDYQTAHEYADVDATTMAIHHTLGPGAVQAAQGNHKHDDRYALITHEHGPSEPAPHEHPLYLPIVDDVAPTVNPDGTPLKVGQLWIDTDPLPLMPEFFNMDYGSTAFTITGTGSYAKCPSYDTLLYTPPCPGILIVHMDGWYKPGDTSADCHVQVLVEGSGYTNGTSVYGHVSDTTAEISIHIVRHIKITTPVQLKLNPSFSVTSGSTATVRYWKVHGEFYPYSAMKSVS